MNKEAPIGADCDLTISLIITEVIGTNWCLFIHCNCAPERYYQIATNVDITESINTVLITVRMKRKKNDLNMTVSLITE